MLARSLGECLGENVTVLGYPPLPAWLLTDSRQARQGFDTNVMMFHNWLNVLQMASPRAAGINAGKVAQ